MSSTWAWPIRLIIRWANCDSRAKCFPIAVRLPSKPNWPAIGASDQRTVELYLIDADGKPQKRGSKASPPTPGEARQIEFRLGSLDLGPHQGYLRIVGQDGLAADDTRYFSVEVKPPWRILIAAPKPAESYSLFLTEALAPSVFRKRGQARFDCDIVDLEELSKKNLPDYAAVFLFDPTPLEPNIWQKLTDYAAEGHGVAIFLGRNAQSIDSFNTPQAQELLPGNLLRQARRPEGDLHLSPRDLQHPIFAPFRVTKRFGPLGHVPRLSLLGIGQAASRRRRGAAL